jgi:hypothetical protein
VAKPSLPRPEESDRLPSNLQMATAGRSWARAGYTELVRATRKTQEVSNGRFTGVPSYTRMSFQRAGNRVCLATIIPKRKGPPTRRVPHLSARTIHTRVGDRLALFYDGNVGAKIPQAIRSHLNRDIGLAWLRLLLVPPQEK